MSGKRFRNSTLCAKNEASREGAGNTRPALDTNAYTGGATMPVSGTIPPCGDSAIGTNTDQNENAWKPVGDMARALVEQASRIREEREGGK